jgi:hypothetical protein
MDTTNVETPIISLTDASTYKALKKVAFALV